jgi:catechol 2,3-dioxygenase-like lactoylglutathione lyase family enzyme
MLGACAVGAVLAYLPGAACVAEEPSVPVHVGALINVSDLDRSIDYFTRLVGLKEATRVPIGPGAWEVILSLSGNDFDGQVGLVYQPDHAKQINQGNGFNRLVFFVKSAAEVDERAGRIASEGYQTVIPPSTSPIPGGRLYRYAHVKGPDGYTIEFTYFDPKVIMPK